MALILLEGIPGSGKSTVIKAIIRKKSDITLMHEFQFRRNVISKEYGTYFNGDIIYSKNLRLKELEDKLEDFILKNRYQDNSNDFEKLKLELARERIKETNNYQGRVIFESFFSGLIDKCSENFLAEIKKLLIYINDVLFLVVEDRELEKRQRKRIIERDGKYDDATNKERNKLFLKQFYEVIEKRVKIIYLDAMKMPEEIVDDIIKNSG
ncbi:hypothetical protein HY498_04315 [Candidatus Woesearchaeota archaeon]|nr:hypothetical protein [Candidatus Woesearchaeota archaeon]